MMRFLPIAALAMVVPTVATAAPQRIVSLNLCADELLLRLAQPGQVASVTWLARDERQSTVANLAGGIPANGGAVEEILAARPDLVIAGTYTTRTTVRLLRLAGLEVLELPPPTTLEESREAIRTVAARIGAQERGEALLLDLNEKFAGAASVQAPIRTAVIGAYGFPTGPGSLLDDLIGRAGFTNIVRVQDENREFSLEDALLLRPQALIIDAEPGGGPALASEIVHHPALRKLAADIAIVSLPSRLWTCPGPQLGTAVDVLRRAAEGIHRRQRGY
ncbi:ABC transporter substrate-binding protein [Terrihabitans rhizophilus]|uniref:ABC transporter substrate-binding protein n=1 Tax=Terrihabitans rhizophilus TaxID=3092662 RepID=A0ABU4RNR2_9HYPH|nr:ABC transporter substrate-binding protein [Terrihabitans sp. PJ23]MDX6805818.1 ABC transporter substrate-binding protein [Terrihabitans sp. PJ23]